MANVWGVTLKPNSKIDVEVSVLVKYLHITQASLKSINNDGSHKYDSSGFSKIAVQNTSHTEGVHTICELSSCKKQLNINYKLSPGSVTFVNLGLNYVDLTGYIVLPFNSCANIHDSSLVIVRHRQN